MKAFRFLQVAASIAWLMLIALLSCPFLCAFALFTHESQRDELARKYRRIMNRLTFSTP